MAEPLLIPIPRGRFILLSIGMGVLALTCLGFCALAIFSSTFMGWVFVLGLTCAVVFGGLAMFFCGVALHTPLALRMDSHGISGFYAEPALWEEISDIALVDAKVAVVRGQHRHRFLGFTLHDPVGFRDRQTAWRRFTSWSNGRGSGYHIVVPEMVLQGITLEAATAQAKALHQAAMFQ